MKQAIQLGFLLLFSLVINVQSQGFSPIEPGKEKTEQLDHSIHRSKKKLKRFKKLKANTSNYSLYLLLAIFSLAGFSIGLAIWWSQFNLLLTINLALAWLPILGVLLCLWLAIILFKAAASTQSSTKEWDVQKELNHLQNWNIIWAVFFGLLLLLNIFAILTAGPVFLLAILVFLPTMINFIVNIQTIKQKKLKLEQIRKRLGYHNLFGSIILSAFLIYTIILLYLLITFTPLPLSPLALAFIIGLLALPILVWRFIKIGQYWSKDL
jgi:hypothetical protein